MTSSWTCPVFAVYECGECHTYGPLPDPESPTDYDLHVDCLVSSSDRALPFYGPNSFAIYQIQVQIQSFMIAPYTNKCIEFKFRIKIQIEIKNLLWAPRIQTCTLSSICCKNCRYYRPRLKIRLKTATRNMKMQCKIGTWWDFMKATWYKLLTMQSPAILDAVTPTVTSL